MRILSLHEDYFIKYEPVARILSKFTLLSSEKESREGTEKLAFPQ
jgi:hypothetical protein